MTRLLVVDNYDSFTFNLVDALEALGARCTVVLHDAVGVAELVSAAVDAFVISPGPCAPEQSGVSLPLLRAALAGEERRPILGVCLGHQALAFAAGARIVRAPRPVHGKISLVDHDGRGLFEGAPAPLAMTRYNSLVVERETLPPELAVSATSRDDGAVMGLRHATLPLESVQFHPESAWSEGGPALLGRWLAGVSARKGAA